MGYPCLGRVWFDGGRRYRAAIYRTTNGFAVAVLSKKDAVEIIKREGLRVRISANKIVVARPPYGDGEDVIKCKRGRGAFFDGGWSLNHECEGGFPPPLPAEWRANFDPR